MQNCVVALILGLPYLDVLNMSVKFNEYNKPHGHHFVDFEIWSVVSKTLKKKTVLWSCTMQFKLFLMALKYQRILEVDRGI